MASLITSLCLGLVSFMMAGLIAIPQLIQLIKSRNSSGISLWTYVIYIVSSVIWLLWAFLYYFNAMANEESPSKLFQWSMMPAIMVDIFNIFTLSYILGIKVKYSSQAKNLNISELDLSKILTEKDKNHPSKKYLGIILYLIMTAIVIAAVTTIISIFGYVQIQQAKKWNVLVIIMNAIAAISWEAISWPQFIKSIKVKDTTGLSLFWAIFFPLSNAITFGYDLTLLFSPSQGLNYGILCALIFNGLIPTTGVLILKIVNMVKAKKHHMSEKEYTIKYIKGGKRYE